MSDIMKGYNNRNRRRRSSNRRKRTAKFYNMSNRDNYITRNQYRSRGRRRAPAAGLGKVAFIFACVAVIAVAMLIVVRSGRFSRGNDPLKVVSGGGVAAGQPAGGESQTATAVAASTPAPDAVPVDGPGDKSGASATAAPATAAQDPAAVSQAVSGGGAAENGGSGTVQGGVSEAAAAVGNISPSAFSEPTPAPRSKAVALTFDDGPSTVNTPKILEVLKKYNAHATFFVLGNRVEKGADLIKQEIEMGCEIASHSWDHANLSKLPMKKVNKQFDRTAKIVKKMTGYDVTLLRPPYGAISDKMREKFKHPMLLWSIDTLDWKYLDGKKEFKVVKKNVSDGDIILMHDIHAKSSEGLAKIIPWLIEQDYDLLTVSELMERKGIKMKNGKVYASGK